MNAAEVFAVLVQLANAHRGTKRAASAAHELAAVPFIDRLLILGFFADRPMDPDSSFQVAARDGAEAAGYFGRSGGADAYAGLTRCLNNIFAESDHEAL